MARMHADATMSLKIILLCGDDAKRQLFPALATLRGSGVKLVTVKRCDDAVIQDPSRWLGIVSLVPGDVLKSYDRPALYLLVVDDGGQVTKEVTAEVATAAGCPAYCIAPENCDMLLALTGNPEPSSFSAAHHASHGLAVPYFLPAFERFLIREVPTAELLSPLPDRSLVPVTQSYHVKYLQGDVAGYEEYIAAHIGREICDDHSPGAFEALRARFEYPYITPEGEAAYVLVKELRNKTTGQKGYCILDGTHRAAILIARGDTKLHVAILDPPPYKAVVPADIGPVPIHLDAFTFATFGPIPVASRKRARKLCEQGLVLLNGARAFSGVFVQPGDTVTIDAGVDPQTVICATATVTYDQAGARLDRFSQQCFRHVLTSRSEAYGACERGDVVVQGRPMPPNYRIAKGDRIALKHTAASAFERLAEALALDQNRNSDVSDMSAHILHAIALGLTLLSPLPGPCTA